MNGVMKKMMHSTNKKIQIRKKIKTMDLVILILMALEISIIIVKILLTYQNKTIIKSKIAKAHRK